MIEARLIEEVRKYIQERLICEEKAEFDAVPMGFSKLDGDISFEESAPVPASKPRKAKAAFPGLFEKRRQTVVNCEEKVPEPVHMADICAGSVAVSDARQELEGLLAEKDESFSEYLIGRIDAAGMTDAECYTKAQITRQLFNRIKNIKGYRPSKTTVIALGFALELPEEEFGAMLRKAGYSLSNSSEFDLIIDYCVNHGMHDIYDINELLLSFDQQLLGSK